MALKLGKKYAFYSPSIGPFNKSNKKYMKLATQVLKKAEFVSLRDRQSYSFANDLGVDFKKAIDTAYLEKLVDFKLPKEVNELLPDKYVLVVPHQLFKWHPDFKQYDSDLFNKMYNAIINEFLKNDHKVVLLPQTFESNLNDEGYFEELKGDNPNIIVIPTKYSSDIQQKIIEKADFVVGARYHTIVFSIHTLTHFYCLSYEHKMIDMLRILGLEEDSTDVSDVLKDADKIAEMIYSKFSNKTQSEEALIKANKLAIELADNCFLEFENCLDRQK